MTVVELKLGGHLPRIDLGASRSICDPAEIELGLMHLSVQLDNAMCDGSPSDLPDLFRLSAELGAFELLLLLRDLRAVMVCDDGPARGALYARIQRQIEADLAFVMSLADPTGQSDR